ncbi:hypothetical protein [Streptomyces sp. NPDC001450]
MVRRQQGEQIPDDAGVFQAPAVPRDPRWVVAIDAASRRIEQIARSCASATRRTLLRGSLFDLGAGIPVPDSFWPTVEGRRPVVLCGPLRGEPTTENLDNAKRAGTLRDIATRTLIT